MSNKKSKLVIYKAVGGDVKLEVSLWRNTIWLTQSQIADLFGTQRPAVVKHIGNIYESNELKQMSTCSILEQVAVDGRKRKMNFYNLDMIISVGYRVNSKKATQFRIWATCVLRQHILQGYTINEKRLFDVQNRFKELPGISE
jgi:hypothetical protein